MTTYRFEQIRHFTEKIGTCPVCGKQTKRRQTFWQTINPWNIDADGAIKTYEQIRDELRAEADAWRPDFTHLKCRDGSATETSTHG